MTRPEVELQPIGPSDIERVAQFLNAHLNDRLSTDAWASAIRTTWPGHDTPNYGFMLLREGLVVGVNLAFYSSRSVDGTDQGLCNLAALCVQDEYRSHTVRLMRAILQQKNLSFTDISPSGNVIAMNERMGFKHLDTTTIVRPNLPTRPAPGVKVLTDLGQIESTLSGRDLRVFQDHQRCRAARHIVLCADDHACYIVFRIDRRKRLRLFASLLYISDPAIFATHGAHLGWSLLAKYKAPVTLVEARLIDGQDGRVRGVRIAGRPKMYKSSILDEAQIDYLYSELTCVPW